MQLSFNHKEGEMEKRKEGFVLSTLPSGPGPRPYHTFEFWEALKCPFEGSFSTGGGVNLENDSDSLYILF